MDRGHPEIPPVPDDLGQLGVDVPPLPHPGVAEEMVAAEAPEPGLGHPLELPVVGLPDVEEDQEVRLGMAEPAVGLVGLGLPVERTLPGVLDAQGRGDDQDLPEGLLPAGLEDHPADGRVGRKPGEVAADLAQRPSGSRAPSSSRSA